MFTKKLINFWFWIILYLGMPQKLPKGALGKFRQVWVWLGMPGHTQPKIFVSCATFPWWIYPCKKSKKLIHSFQRYWSSTILAIWLDKRILTHNLWTRISQIWGLHWKADNCNVFHFRLLPVKSSNEISGSFCLI